MPPEMLFAEISSVWRLDKFPRVEGREAIMDEELRSSCSSAASVPNQSGMLPGKVKPEELKLRRYVKFCNGSSAKAGRNAPFTVLLKPVNEIEITLPSSHTMPVHTMQGSVLRGQYRLRMPSTPLRVSSVAASDLLIETSEV